MQHRLARLLAIEPPAHVDLRITRKAADFPTAADWIAYRMHREWYNAYNRSRYAADPDAHPQPFYLRRARTPVWADRNAIAKFYRDARGRGFSVDHVVPLRGERVSGLHVEYNLQMIPQLTNILKSNRYDSQL